MAAPAVRPTAVTSEKIDRDVGSVLWSLIPVSPVTPLTVMEVVLPAGGTTVTAVTVTPVLDGTVTELNPLESVWTVTEAGEAVFSAAVTVCVPAGGPEEYTMEMVRLAVGM